MDLVLPWIKGFLRGKYVYECEEERKEKEPLALDMELVCLRIIFFSITHYIF